MGVLSSGSYAAIERACNAVTVASRQPIDYCPASMSEFDSGDPARVRRRTGVGCSSMASTAVVSALTAGFFPCGAQTALPLTWNVSSSPTPRMIVSAL